VRDEVRRTGRGTWKKDSKPGSTEKEKGGDNDYGTKPISKRTRGSRRW